MSMLAWILILTKEAFMRIFLVLFMGMSILFPSWTLANNITQEYRLDNGLKIIVHEDNSVPVILSSIWYRVGGSYENNGKTGISHLLEHMMFKGTSQHGLGVFNKKIAQVGGEQNAMTSPDFTVYYQKLPANQLALSFQLEADRMKNLLLDQSEFNKEKKVVIEERRMRVEDNPQGIAWERFRAAAFINNPYHHPVVGWMTDLKHLTLPDVSAWYRDWYMPNNAVLVIVGDVEPNQVLILAKKFFGPIPAGNTPKVSPRSEVASLGERKVALNIPTKTSLLMMGYNVPTLGTTAPKKQGSIYALALASYILGGGNSARLNTNIVKKQGAALSAASHYDLYELHQGLFMLTAIPDPKTNLKALQKSLIKEVTKLKNKAVSKKELDRVKAQLIANNIFKKDSLMQVAFELGVPEMIGQPWQVGHEFAKRVMAVTSQEIQAAAKQYFTTNNLTVLTLQPKSKG